MLNDKCSITIKDQDVLDEVLADNNFWVEGNNLVEKYMALSMCATVESLENVTIDDKGYVVKPDKAKVKYDYIPAKKIYPITFYKGKLTECAFVSEGTNTVNISIHKLNAKKEYEVIKVTLTFGKGGSIGKEDVYTFQTKSKKPLYQIWKANVANNKDIDSPLGISIFANAIDTLKAIDKTKTNKTGNTWRSAMGYKSEHNQLNSGTEYVQKFTNYPTTILEYAREKEQIHPTQKPTDLLEFLIQTYTNENDVVLDNSMGSGSTGVACINTNRRFIGIEKERYYYDLARSRIAT